MNPFWAVQAGCSHIRVCSWGTGDCQHAPNLRIQLPSTTTSLGCRLQKPGWLRDSPSSGCSRLATLDCPWCVTQVLPPTEAKGLPSVEARLAWLLCRVRWLNTTSSGLRLASAAGYRLHPLLCHSPRLFVFTCSYQGSQYFYFHTTSAPLSCQTSKSKVKTSA